MLGTQAPVLPPVLDEAVLVLELLLAVLELPELALEELAELDDAVAEEELGPPVDELMDDCVAVEAVVEELDEVWEPEEPVVAVEPEVL